MKICIIGPTYPYRGGISHYNTLLCENLKKKHEVLSISYKRLYPSFLYPGKGQRDTKSSIRTDAIEKIDSINPLTWFYAFSFIKGKKPDMIIMPWWTPFFAPLYFTILFLTKHFTKAKTLLLCHNVLPHEKRIVDEFLSKMVFKMADFFVVHSTEDYKNLKKMLPSANVRLAFHPTYDVFKSNTNAKLKSDRIILFFGFVRKYKGLIYLIEAMPKILREINAKLLIVGEFWDNKGAYISRIKELSIEDSVKIIDRYVSDAEVEKYFTMADIVVLPYLSATNSGIVQIAYAFEKPVVVTNVGGLPEAVKHGKTGFIIPPKDSNAISDTIIQYFKDCDRVEFAKNIRNEKKTFSWDGLVEIVEGFA